VPWLVCVWRESSRLPGRLLQRHTNTTPHKAPNCLKPQLHAALASYTDVVDPMSAMAVLHLPARITPRVCATVRRTGCASCSSTPAGKPSPHAALRLVRIPSLPTPPYNCMLRALSLPRRSEMVEKRSGRRPPAFTRAHDGSQRLSRVPHGQQLPGEASERAHSRTASDVIAAGWVTASPTWIGIRNVVKGVG
jgi:hypothetical protein